MVRLAVVCGLKGEPGIIGQDEGNCGVLRAIEFWRIKTAKRFDAGVAWFVDMLAEIGQPNLN
jgi:diphosphate-dependent phosphofructokinase